MAIECMTVKKRHAFRVRTSKLREMARQPPFLNWAVPDWSPEANQPWAKKRLQGPSGWKGQPSWRRPRQRLFWILYVFFFFFHFFHILTYFCILWHVAKGQASHCTSVDNRKALNLDCHRLPNFGPIGKDGQSKYLLLFVQGDLWLWGSVSQQSSLSKRQALQSNCKRTWGTWWIALSVDHGNCFRRGVGSLKHGETCWSQFIQHDCFRSAMKSVANNNYIIVAWVASVVSSGWLSSQRPNFWLLRSPTKSEFQLRFWVVLGHLRSGRWGTQSVSWCVTSLQCPYTSFFSSKSTQLEE